MCDYKRDGCEFPLREMDYNLIVFSFLHSGNKDNTQHAMPQISAESDERSVLTLGSVCVTCYIQYTLK